ncbi:MAG: hypothetical protein VYB07_03855 [Actinomycetota bacterium]|nr:hypothetical protein [Actinomycetota bacterium]
MATYDPEAVRSRPAAPKVSPLDDLLDGANSQTNGNDSRSTDELIEDVHEEGDSKVTQNQEFLSNDENYRPFEVPPVESVDEGADRANRLGALIATLALFCLAIFWRKRKKSSL